jgi:polygalacturonase
MNSTPLAFPWRTSLLALLLAASAARGANSPATAAEHQKTFDVRQLGAVGDGQAEDTSAIQRALDRCGQAGGGIVCFAPGIYRSKPLFLRSHTTLLLEAGAILRATDEPADFADPRRERGFLAFLNGEGLTNITLTGPGAVDGSGARWWGPAREAKRTNKENPGYTLPRPRLILLNRCQGVVVTNLTLSNSPCFHLVPSECEDVLIENVRIIAPADSPNTDAIDPSASKHVRISRCLLDVGDDNVAIKSGHSVAGRTAASEDILITDCTCLHGHGISIGSETSGGVRNILVQRCTFEDTDNGIRIKSPRGKGGTVENCTYTDITMKNVDPAITLTCYYPKIPKEDAAQPVATRTPVFRNIRITNLNATCSRAAGVIVGLPESPVSDVVLENVSISAPTTGLEIRNAKGVRLKNVRVTAGQGRPYLVENAQVEGLEQSQ